LDEYRKQWRAAHDGPGGIPTQRTVGRALGIPHNTIRGHVAALTEAGRMLRFGKTRSTVMFVPNEPEFTSALSNEEEA